MSCPINGKDLLALQAADDKAREAQFRLKQRRDEFQQALMNLLCPTTRPRAVHRLQALLFTALAWDRAEAACAHAEVHLHLTISRVNRGH